MDQYPIQVNTAKGSFTFVVKDYMLGDAERCKFRVYAHDSLQASFQPDRLGILHPCSNEAGLDNDVLCAIASELERLNF